jgi:eukaryotic-like serine/threonine-protein kinase
MALTIGTKLGSYEITALLGEGGMGQVYKARDTRLGRDVALKVLPTEFMENSSRRDRFEHEARAVAALNHPNILALYDIGSANGMAYMVTELVEGETLKRVFPPRKALDIAAQIADGLAAAHAAGVTHRDLKPDNVMVTHNGRAKILDFGLAKVACSPGEEGPTVTRTEPGTVMGTVGYMSPEQVRGADADYRSDIFSFGVVLHEMFGGTRAFKGETAVEVMNAILKEDPSELPETVPTGVREIVAHCLEKKPEQRFQSAQDLAFALRSVGGRTTSSLAAFQVVQAAHSRKIRWLIAPLLLTAGVLIGGVAALRWSAALDTSVDPIKLTRLAAEPEMEAYPAFSPDGRSVAYMRSGGGKSELVVKPLDSPTSVSVVTLSSIQGLTWPVWTADGTRVCYTSLRDLWCVGAAGGTPQRLIEDVASASFTRDGKSLVFIRIENSKPRLFVSSPPTAEPKPVDGITLPESATELAGFSPDGSKLLLKTNTLNLAGWVTRYPAGSPKEVESPEGWASAPVGWFLDSRHVVIREVSPGLRFRLVLADTESRARRLVVPDTGAIISATVGPDGKQIIYSTGQPDWDILEYSMDGKRLRPMVTSPEMDVNPSWSPAGDRFLYGITTTGTTSSLWTKNTDGSGAFMVTNTLGLNYRYSPDGRRIASAIGFLPGSRSGIETMPATGGRPVRILSSTRNIINLCWSPDGEWLWYSETGELSKVPSQGGQPVAVKDQVEQLVDCSPDGRLIAYTAKDGVHLVSPDAKQDRLLTGEKIYSIRGQFGEGGKVLYLLRTDVRTLDIIDVMTGKARQTIQFDLAPADQIGSFSVHPDGKRILLSTGGLRYDLWMAEGFPQPAKGWMSWFRHWEISAPPAGGPESQGAPQ